MSDEKLRIPGSGADMPTDDKEIDDIISAIPPGEAYIRNMYYQKEFLTRQEAIMLVNTITGMLLVDECNRSKAKHPKYT